MSGRECSAVNTVSAKGEKVCGSCSATTAICPTAVCALNEKTACKVCTGTSEADCDSKSTVTTCDGDDPVCKVTSGPGSYSRVCAPRGQCKQSCTSGSCQCTEISICQSAVIVSTPATGAPGVTTTTRPPVNQVTSQVLVTKPIPPPSQCRPDQRASCKTCLDVSSEAECDARGYDEYCPMPDAVCESWVKSTSPGGGFSSYRSSFYSRRCVARSSCHPDQVKANNGLYATQSCSPAKCGPDQYKDAPVTYLPTCNYCEYANSEADCQSKGMQSKCSMNDPVCETEHRWGMKNGVKSLNFFRKCQSSNLCKAGWSPSPFPNGDPRNHEITHTSCDPPSFQPPFVPHMCTMWFRFDMTWQMSFGIKYSIGWWKFTSSVTPFLHSCFSTVVTGFVSISVKSCRQGSVIVEAQMTLNETVTEVMLNKIAVQTAQAFIGKEFEYEGVKSRMSLLNVFPSAADDIGSPSNINGSTTVNITTWDMSYYCQDNDFNLCQNGGTCSNDQYGHVTCECPPGYTGPYCNIAPGEAAKANVALFATIGVLLPIAAIILIVLLVLLCRQRMKNERETIYNETREKYRVGNPDRSAFPAMTRATAFVPSYRSPLGNFLGAQGINPGAMPGPRYRRGGAMGGDWDPTDPSGLDTLHRNMIGGNKGRSADDIDGRFWRPINTTQAELYRNPSVLNQNLQPSRLYQPSASYHGSNNPFQFPAFNNSRFGWNTGSQS